MNEIDVGDFIKSHLGKKVWFVTPAGLFRGTISDEILEADQNVIFTVCNYLTGKDWIDVGKFIILKNNIIGWGDKDF